jgi:hypothetical protein
MKTNVLTLILTAGALAGGTEASFAQQTVGQPNPVISSPPPASSAPSSSGAQPSTANRFGTAVENFIGRLFGNEQSQLNFDQLPQAAQNTIRAEAGTSPIENIKQVNTNGQTSYVVTLNRNGQNVDFQVDPFGRILNGSSVGMGQAGTPNVVSQPPAYSPAPAYSQQPAYQQPSSAYAIPNWRTAPVREPLMDSRVIGLATLPQQAQNTLLRYAGPNGISLVQQGSVNGQTVYEAQLHPNGQMIALRVTPTGAILNDQVDDQFLAQYSRNPNYAVGQAPAGQTGGSFDVNRPLVNTVPVQFNQLPAAVQTTINGQANGAPINSIAQGMLNGRPAYDVTFVQGGRQVTLRVGQDGSVLGSTSSSQ